VTFDEPSFSVHLIDYEAACFADRRQTPIGAAGFAPPEQIRGEAVLSSDLYSLAATAFFLATAELPPNLARAGESPVAFPHAVWGSMTRLDERYGHEKVVRCWARDPQERPLSARQFLANVEVPGTRMWEDAKPLGIFTCGRDCRVALADQFYSVERTPA
jgi:serine/threonine protein kinase